MKHVKLFESWLNEGSEQALEPKLRRDDLYDLMMDDYEAFEKECNKIAADAIGCKPKDIYFVGSPVNDDTLEDPIWPKIKDLLSSGNGWPKKPGKLLFWFDADAPDGHMKACHWKHNGIDVVMFDGEDGPFIYVKK